MEWIIIACFFATSVLIFYAILYMMVNSDQRLEKRIYHYLDVSETKKLEPKQWNMLMHLYTLKNKIAKPLALNKNVQLKIRIESAGLPLKPEEFIIFQWIATFLCGGVFYLISGKLFPLLLGLVIGYIVPDFWLKSKQNKRLNEFNAALPDMITTVVGSLRAGFSFPQALKTVADETKGPMKEEIDKLLKELQFGLSVENALNNLNERMPSEDLELMIHVIIIQRQVGGNLATVLDKIVDTIRERKRIQQQIITLTAQGRLSGVVIGLLPIILGIVIYLIEPDYVGTLFSHPIGIGMLIMGVISGIIGYVLIRKMTMIEV
ncbi:type II secretion system protein [Desulfuribacillus stibiiarsenatis]|uniref:Type II secretion system protein n=1 Tax=Desulfuribacillus stibiiarsenatis TaxID=1390249 RepID=A0A1E5L872_9FIRM|nr:type II secretion system F family protein [Desulfuribacillus stibiiarsenatis]OEH86189.1 type II secretion system protein [Desulfuribacillus stibiiarsenatis]